MGTGQRVPDFVPPQTEMLLIYVVKVLAFLSAVTENKLPK